MSSDPAHAPSERAFVPTSDPISKTADNPRQRLKQARRALYREAIIDAAEREFAEHGYDATKVQAIAKAAGVSLATFYAVFPKKWDAFAAVQGDRLGRLMQRVGARVLGAPDAFGRLRAGLEGYLRFHMEHPDFLRMQLRERVPWGTTDELRTPEQTRAWEAGLQMMIAALREGMAEGVFRSDDPELCARMATAMSQVRLALWVGGDMEPEPSIVARDAMRQFVRTFAADDQVEPLLRRVDASA